MRIGIDARFYGPDSKGLGRYTQKLITYLEDVDTENEYVIFLRKNNFDLYTPKNSRFTKVIADYQWYSFGEQILFPLTLYKSKCDFVHFLHFNVPIFYFKKFIVTIHDLILLRYPTRRATTRNIFFYWFKFFLYRIVIAYAVLFSERVIAVSQFTKDDICNQYPHSHKKIVVVYEAAEFTEIDETNGVSLDKYGILNTYMLYVGNAYPHKNLHSLVDAFALYKDKGGLIENLVLVGKKDYFYNELEKYISAQDISHIIILDTVGDDVLDLLYEKASVFVFPSLYEGFGLPPLEAQLHGLPVVSSLHPCMQEILSLSGAQYCDTEDVVAFALAIDQVVSNEKLREKLIACGLKNAQKYSWEKMAKKIYNIYKRI
ncbi:MAG: hypothetical protein CR972_01195 [Candidatus Moraniibacteriota bacterium]|nr:MAG: hypothetical protein CR972_01195 [Candidatus Moranbacteria bacterium]